MLAKAAAGVGEDGSVYKFLSDGYLFTTASWLLFSFMHPTTGIYAHAACSSRFLLYLPTWEPCDCAVDAKHQYNLVKGRSLPVNVRPASVLSRQHRHVGAMPEHRPAVVWGGWREACGWRVCANHRYDCTMRCRCVWAPQELYFLIR